MLHLSSIPHDVVDLLSISIDVFDSPLRDPERHPQPPSGGTAACSLPAFVHFPLSQVFRHHVGGIFVPLALSRGSAHGVHRLLHPQDLGVEMSLVPHSAS